MNQAEIPGQQIHAGGVLAYDRGVVLKLLMRLCSFAAVCWRGTAFSDLIKVVAWVRRITLKGSIIGFTLAVVLTLVLWEMSQYPGTIVKSISVPPELAKMGYAPDVVSHRLIDSAHRFRKEVNTSMPIELPKPGKDVIRLLRDLSKLSIIGDIGDDDSLLRQFDTDYQFMAPKLNIDTDGSSKLDFVLPAMGVSIKSLAAYLHSLFCSPTTVSGELLHAGAGKGISLRLRVDGRKLPDVPRKTNEAEIDELLQDGAYELIKKIEPRILASYHFLTGKRYQMKRESEKAIEEFRKAVQHDDEFGLAYYSWSLVLASQGEDNEALEKYSKAYSLLSLRPGQGKHRWYLPVKICNR